MSGCQQRPPSSARGRVNRGAWAVAAAVGLALPPLAGCGDGGSGDAGSVDLAASREAAARKGKGGLFDPGGSSLAGKPLPRKKAR